jgi:preprotein translocase subunit SecE
MNAIKEISADPEAPDSDPPEPYSGGRSADADNNSGALETTGVSSALGLTRWVQYVFVVGAALLLWFLDKVATLTWQNFAEPPAVVITAGSVVVSIVGTLALYRNERAHTLVTEVVAELAKVTWPTRKETYASTIVVIITSLLAAGIVGAFDFVWSFLTDLLYKHKV